MSPSQSGTRKRMLARFQRLCCLGISDTLLVPEVIRDVIELIPSRNGVFYWIGPRLEITNVYSTISPAIMDLFFKDFYLTSRETMLLRTFSKFKYWPSSTPVRQLDDDLLVDRRTFLHSDFYNLLWREAGIYQSLKLCVRSAGRVHALLHIHRAEGEPAYGPNDVRMLESIAGFIAHGMTRVTLREGAFADSDDHALFAADPDGCVQYADRSARHLLAMALNPRFSPTVRMRGLTGAVPELTRLCHTLASIADGQVGQQPPVLRLRNPWGEFVLRAYWLGPTDGIERTRQIGITIERRVPRALALRRRVEDLPLTAREKQLCLLIGRDPSCQDLADTMGLAASTVITHQRSIYSKLGVHSRAGLLAAITAR